MHLEVYREIINDYLDHHIPPEHASPVPIHEAMRYSLFAGGKRLRPALLLLVGETLGGKVELFLPAAASVEMVHTYSLIHDDLPSMDNDDYRRGKLTNHKVYGEAIAILAGDALLTLAVEHLSKAPYSPEIRCRLLQLLTRAAGTQGMIGGQVLDMLGAVKNLDRVDLEKMHAMKTAALIGFAAVAPAVILEKGSDVEQSFGVFGESMGLAFQIVDDILDVEGTTQSLGKTAGKDQSAGKVTYPVMLGLAESRRLAADLIAVASKSVAAYDSKGRLKEFAEHILNRKK